MDKEELKTIIRKEFKDTIKKAYDEGYHEGFADACDTLALASINAITDTVTKLREAAQEAEAEAIDELEEEHGEQS